MDMLRIAERRGFQNTYAADECTCIQQRAKTGAALKCQPMRGAAAETAVGQTDRDKAKGVSKNTIVERFE